MRRYKQHIDFQEIDRLLDRYYDGLTTVEEENLLRSYLQRPGLPEQYHAEQAIFGYFGAQKSKPAFTIRPYLKWMTGVAATIALLVGLNFYTQPVSAGNFAFVDGQKITNNAEVKNVALASLKNLPGAETEIKESLENVSNADVINQQLTVFAEQ